MLYDDEIGNFYDELLILQHVTGANAVWQFWDREFVESVNLHQKMHSQVMHSGKKKRTRNVQYRRSETNVQRTLCVLSSSHLYTPEEETPHTLSELIHLCKIAAPDTSVVGASNLGVVGRGEDLGVASLALV
jgi:hypothetical protein